MQEYFYDLFFRIPLLESEKRSYSVSKNTLIFDRYVAISPIYLIYFWKVITDVKCMWWDVIYNANMQNLQTFINLKDIDGKHLMPFVFLAEADIFLKLSQIFLRETRSIYHKSNFSSNKSRERILSEGAKYFLQNRKWRSRDCSEALLIWYSYYISLGSGWSVVKVCGRPALTNWCLSVRRLSQ